MLLEQVTCLSPQSIAEPRNRRSEFTSSPIYCSSCSQIHRRPTFTWMRALSRPKAPSMRRPPTTRHLHPALAGMVRGRDSQMILFAGTWVGSSRFPYLQLANDPIYRWIRLDNWWSFYVLSCLHACLIVPNLFWPLLHIFWSKLQYRTAHSCRRSSWPRRYVLMYIIVLCSS
jgi:hypothetical protein